MISFLIDYMQHALETKKRKGLSLPQGVGMTSQRLYIPYYIENLTLAKDISSTALIMVLTLFGITYCSAASVL